jgi:hypothetical protein
LQAWGTIYYCRYRPPSLKLKIGSKEPKNRLKLNPLTVSKSREGDILPYERDGR